MSNVQFVVQGEPHDYLPMVFEGIEIAPYQDTVIVHERNVPLVLDGTSPRPLQTGDRVTLATFTGHDQHGVGVSEPFGAATVHAVHQYDAHHIRIVFRDARPLEPA